jgi:hypothetical protein
MAGYRIADEPVPGRLAGAVVNPFWPLLASMLVGFWLALPWFALNAVAMGSATRRRELGWIALGAAVSAAAGGALLWAAGGELVPVATLRYAFIVLVAWRIGVAYAVYALQSPSFELHEHFGGVARSGLLVVLAGTFVPLPRLLGREAAVYLQMLVG